MSLVRALLHRRHPLHCQFYCRSCGRLLILVMLASLVLLLSVCAIVFMTNGAHERQCVGCGDESVMLLMNTARIGRRLQFDIHSVREPSTTFRELQGDALSWHITPAFSPPFPQSTKTSRYIALHSIMFGGSGPHTKRSTYHLICSPGNGPNAPVRLPSIKTPVRKHSSVVVSFYAVFGCGVRC